MRPLLRKARKIQENLSIIQLKFIFSHYIAEIHSFIPLFICARHNSNCLGVSGAKNRSSACSHGYYILVGGFRRTVNK